MPIQAEPAWWAHVCRGARTARPGAYLSAEVICILRSCTPSRPLWDDLTHPARAFRRPQTSYARHLLLSPACSHPRNSEEIDTAWDALDTSPSSTPTSSGSETLSSPSSVLGHLRGVRHDEYRLGTGSTNNARVISSRTTAARRGATTCTRGPPLAIFLEFSAPSAIPQLRWSCPLSKSEAQSTPSRLARTRPAPHARPGIPHHEQGHDLECGSIVPRALALRFPVHPSAVPPGPPPLLTAPLFPARIDRTGSPGFPHRLSRGHFALEPRGAGVVRRVSALLLTGRVAGREARGGPAEAFSNRAREEA
ncbi:hypothetical protein DFH07DRAFT_964299 [Mycena maculata]|uniref:Uncharacterized protein n=1 Tax=Mycena maculata TaxID=230809 RepID=A0AAD7N3L7_9AGAR|nr:hypothetical protein DFH07DRAFT_964299 [Mycena maculata]